MKMLEEILEKGTDGNLDLEGLREAAHDQLEVFLIDNVAEYLYAQTDQEVWDVKTDFPCLAPPFPSFWMEFGRPSKIVSCDNGVMEREILPYRVGLWFVSQRTDQMVADATTKDNLKRLSTQLKQYLNTIWTPEIERELTAFMEAGGKIFDSEQVCQLSEPARLAAGALTQYKALERAADIGELTASIEGLQQTTRWLMDCYVFVQSRRHGDIYGPMIRLHLQLDADGNVIHTGVGKNLNVRPELHEGLTTLWFSGLLAISFCHCKNVSVQSMEKPAALKARQIKAGRTPLTYKILEISPLKQVLRHAGAEGQTGLKRALHICRGHFAVYGDKGLFGKYRGRFWISQHLRGSTETGLVIKDYAVKP